ncbi:MAG: BMC domain-containing protein [Clostridia bacterium]|nr:BMC domain-containing protein [Clostridia bacterium]
MRKIEALGVIDTLYFTIATEILDESLKMADIEFLHKESALGGKLVTLFIAGSVASVTEVIEFVNRLKETTHKEYIKNAIVISRPHEGILEYILSPEEEAISNGSEK